MVMLGSAKIRRKCIGDLMRLTITETSVKISQGVKKSNNSQDIRLGFGSETGLCG